MCEFSRASPEPTMWRDDWTVRLEVSRSPRGSWWPCLCPGAEPPLGGLGPRRAPTLLLFSQQPTRVGCVWASPKGPPPWWWSEDGFPLPSACNGHLPRCTRALTEQGSPGGLLIPLVLGFRWVWHLCPIDGSPACLFLIRFVLIKQIRPSAYLPNQVPRSQCWLLRGPSWPHPVLTSHPHQSTSWILGSSSSLHSHIPHPNHPGPSLHNLLLVGCLQEASPLHFSTSKGGLPSNSLPSIHTAAPAIFYR